MVNLRSGKNCDVNPILVPQAQRGKKRKNLKQCFESDSDDEFLNVLDRKPKIFKKKCNMWASSFRSQVHLKEHISKHPEPDLFIRSLLWCRHPLARRRIPRRALVRKELDRGQLDTASKSCSQRLISFSQALFIHWGNLGKFEEITGTCPAGNPPGALQNWNIFWNVLFLPYLVLRQRYKICVDIFVSRHSEHIAKIMCQQTSLMDTYKYHNKKRYGEHK